MGTLHLAVNVLILFDPYALTIGHNYSCTGVTYIFFSEIQVGTLDQERNLFLFSLEHHAFFGQLESLAKIVVYCSLF